MQSRRAWGNTFQLGDVEHPRAYGQTRARLPTPQPHPAASEESPLRHSNPARPPSPTHLRSSTEPPKREESLHERELNENKIKCATPGAIIGEGECITVFASAEMPREPELREAEVCSSEADTKLSQ